MSFITVMLLLVLLGIILFYLAAGAVIFRRMYVRKGKPRPAPVPKDWNGDEVAMTGMDDALTAHVHDGIIMKPLLEAKRRWYDYPVEKVTNIGWHGTILKGDFWAAENDGEKEQPAVAIIIHGMQDSSSGMAYLAEEYHKRGVHVLTVNLRGHGESHGRLYGLTSVDMKDLLSWIDLMDKRFEGKARFILHGVSMGGGTVLQCIGSKQFAKAGYASKVLVAVSDSPFSNFLEETLNQFEFMFPTRPVFRTFMAYGISFSCWITGHGFLSRISPEKAMARATRLKYQLPPVILFHGLGDILVRPYMSMKIYDRIAGEKQLCLIEKAPHIGSYFYEPENYMSAVEKYL